MVREFVFVLIQITVCWEITFDEELCHVETSQLIFIAMRLFGFYMARDIIEGNFRTFVCSFMLSIDILVLIDIDIDVYGILFVLNLLFNYCSGMCKIILFQRCRLILCNIAGQFSTISNLPKNCNIKKYLN